jgi:hypothetical protein
MALRASGAAAEHRFMEGRRPVWSQLFTDPMARATPHEWRPAVLAAIKGIHTAIFASVGAAIAIFVWDGIRQQPGRRAATALGMAAAEAAVYVSNNQVCPLTPLAEDLGAERGSVADIFLPDWASRRIPLVSVSALLIGLALNLNALRNRRAKRA